MTTWLLPILIDLLSLLPPWLLGRRRRLGWLVSLALLLGVWPVYAVAVGGWGWFPGIVLHAYVSARGYVLWGRGTPDTPSPLH